MDVLPAGNLGEAEETANRLMGGCGFATLLSMVGFFNERARFRLDGGCLAVTDLVKLGEGYPDGQSFSGDTRTCVDKDDKEKIKHS